MGRGSALLLYGPHRVPEGWVPDTGGSLLLLNGLNPEGWRCGAGVLLHFDGMRFRRAGSCSANKTKQTSSTAEAAKKDDEE